MPENCIYRALAGSTSGRAQNVRKLVFSSPGDGGVPGRAQDSLKRRPEHSQPKCSKTELLKPWQGEPQAEPRTGSAPARPGRGQRAENDPRPQKIVLHVRDVQFLDFSSPGGGDPKQSPGQAQPQPGQRRGQVAKNGTRPCEGRFARPECSIIALFDS